MQRRWTSRKDLSAPEDLFNVTDGDDVDSESLRLPHAQWTCEFDQGAPSKCYRTTLNSLVDSCTWEVVVGVSIVLDLALTIISFFYPDDLADTRPLFIAAACILIIFLIDVQLRIFRDGCKFFKGLLNLFEFSIILFGVSVLLAEGVCHLHFECNSAGVGVSSAGLGRTVRTTLRVLRVSRSAFQIVCGRAGLLSRIDGHTDRLASRLVLQYLTDIMKVPPQNINVKVSDGTIHVEKAQVRSGVFQQLHLPFTIQCGVVDLCHFEFSLRNAARMLVIIENVVLVLGPGHHQEPPGPPWDYETVLKNKQRLVDLITRRAEKVSRDGEGGARRNPRTGGLVAWARRKILNFVEEILAHGMHVSIRNVELRYEDDGVLASSRQRVTAGVRVASVMVRAQGSKEDVEEIRSFRSRSRWLDEAADVDAQSSPTRPSTQHKRRLRNGVRCALAVERACCYWDVGKRDVPFTVKLMERSGVDISCFIRELVRASRWERIRLAFCEEIAQRLLQSGQPKHEQVRRLLRLFSVHDYILTPCNCSLHASLRPTRMAKANGSPELDLSFHAASLRVQVDMQQVAGMITLLDYFKRWKREDRRFQWSVPPRQHIEEFSAHATWIYGLHQVLHHIGPTHPWNTLFLIEMRRRAKLKAQLFSALVADPQDKRWVAMLMVALPLVEVMRTRKSAASFLASGKDGEPISSGSLVMEDSGKSTRSLASGSQPARSTSTRSQASTASSRSSDPSSDSDSVLSRLRGGVLASQLDLVIDETVFLLLRPPARWFPSRPLLRWDLPGVRMVAAIAAPQEVWQKLAPPEVNEEESGAGIACEVTIGYVQGVFCAAPSTAAPEMRRIFRCGSDVRNVRHDSVHSSGTTDSDNSAEVALRIRCARLGAVETEWKGGTRVLQSWRVAACVMGTEFNVCKSLMLSLVKTFKLPPPDVPKPPRTECVVVSFSGLAKVKSSLSFSHAVSAGRSATRSASRSLSLRGPLKKKESSISEAPTPDASVFWSDLRALNAQHRLRDNENRQARLYDKIIGESGVLQCSIIESTVLLIGGVRGQMVEPYCNHQWLKYTVSVAAASVSLTRGGLPCEMRCSCRPLKACLRQDGMWTEDPRAVQHPDELQLGLDDDDNTRLCDALNISLPQPPHLPAVCGWSHLTWSLGSIEPLLLDTDASGCLGLGDPPDAVDVKVSVVQAVAIGLPDPADVDDFMISLGCVSRIDD